jgi:outer membrane protein assembly factor BamB
MKRVIIGIIVLFLLVSTFSASLTYTEVKGDITSDDSSWTMYRGGPRHTGSSPFVTDQNEGGLKWTYRGASHFNSASPSIAIALDGTIYMGAIEPSGVISIDKNGKEMWIFPIDSDYRIDHSAPSIGDNGTIYIGAGNYLFAINQNGTEQWRFETKGLIRSSPVVDPNGVIYFGSYDGDVYAVNPDGSLRWNFTTGYKVESSPAVSPDGSIVFSCYLGERTIVSLYSNGTVKWLLEEDGIFKINSPAIDEDGTIYFNGGPANLYAINPNGTIRWIFPTNHRNPGSNGHMVLHPAIGPDGTIYSGSIDGLYAINPDGTQKWRSGPREKTTIPSIDGDGTIFTKTLDGITAFRPDGTERWIYAEEWGLTTEIVIGQDGTVYYYNQNELVALNGEPETYQLQTNLVFILLIIILIVIVLALGVSKKKRNTQG